MEGTDPKSIPFQDQNKANLMTQVIQVSKFFYLFVELLGIMCL